MGASPYPGAGPGRCRDAQPVPADFAAKGLQGKGRPRTGRLEFPCPTNVEQSRSLCMMAPNRNTDHRIVHCRSAHGGRDRIEHLGDVGMIHHRQRRLHRFGLLSYIHPGQSRGEPCVSWHGSAGGAARHGRGITERVHRGIGGANSGGARDLRKQARGSLIRAALSPGGARRKRFQGSGMFITPKAQRKSPSLPVARPARRF